MLCILATQERLPCPTLLTASMRFALRAAFGSSKMLLHFCHMGISHIQAKQQQLKIKKPQHNVLRLCYLNLAMSYFHMGNPTLSSALTGFTSEFEKGSGGSQSLLSPENWSETREYVVPHAIQ